MMVLVERAMYAKQVRHSGVQVDTAYRSFRLLDSVPLSRCSKPPGSTSSNRSVG